MYLAISIENGRFFTRPVSLSESFNLLKKQLNLADFPSPRDQNTSKLRASMS
jgi:hypothetical protein